MATKRDFKYLAILDHKSHLGTIDNKKRKQAVKNNTGTTDGKDFRQVICFEGLLFILKRVSCNP